MSNQINSQTTLREPASSEAAPFSLIGNLAQRTGITTMAIRFYERQGLISPTRIGRFRTYTSKEEQRLQTIVRFRRIGFPIAKIRKALNVLEGASGEQNENKIKTMLEEHLVDLRHKEKEIARQIGHTTDYIVELGVADNGAVASPESLGAAIRDAELEASRSLEE